MNKVLETYMAGRGSNKNCTQGFRIMSVENV